jgi:hypothetical protein
MLQRSIVKVVYLNWDYMTVKKKALSKALLEKVEEKSIEMQILYDRIADLELQVSMLIRCVSEIQKMHKRELNAAREVQSV